MSLISLEFFILIAFITFSFNLTYDNNLIFAETFEITIPLDATTKNIDKPYNPSTINVPSNSTVIWTNNDNTLHTVTSINKTLNTNQFDSGLMPQSGSFRVIFNETGNYPYQCMLHPFMIGNVIVGSNNSAVANNQNPIDVINGSEATIEENPILLTAKEINGAYVWESNGRNNPTLNLEYSKNYNFIIKSLPEDPEEHEFKILLPNGEDIVEAEEVEEGEQSQVSFIPTTPNRLRYYCEYHPESMIGIINILSPKK